MSKQPHDLDRRPVPLSARCRTRRQWAACLAALAVLFSSAVATHAGPLVFARPGAGGVSELWTANANGSGVTRLNVSLPQPDRPIWTKDGTTLLVTSNDPGSSQLSLNVYAVNPANGQANKLTNYADGNEFNQNTQRFESFYSLPLFKAAAPNNTSFAVSRLFRRGIGSDFTTTPILEKKANAGSPPDPLNLGAPLDGFHLAGAGVDWSPQGDNILTPVARTLNNGQTVTPLGVFTPNGSLLGALTNPQAGVFSNGQSWQNDYQPAYSPDGSQVAYFRATEFVNLQTNQRSASDVELRIVNSNGTNDRLVLDFNPGTWANQVSWSPDGSQLLFDLGPQLFQGGQPLFSSNLNQTEIWRVTLGNGNFQRLISSPASFPTWQPSTSLVGQPGDFNRDGAVTLADYNLWASGYGTTLTPGSGPDANGNGSVDAGDYTVWRDAFAQQRRSQSIPEPNAVVLAIAAISFLALGGSRSQF